MSGSLGTRGLAALCFAVALLFLLPATSAQAIDCNSGCDQFIAQEGLTGAQAKEQCLKNCQKLKDLGAEGFSIKCAYELPRTCGAQLAWDLIRHCIKPCGEFKISSCEDCLIKYGFCGGVSECRTWICKRFVKDQTRCEEIFKKGCN